MTGILATDGFGLAAMFTAFGLGLRHGVDWDHLAAIGDLTSSGAGRRRSLVLATLYAVGHAVVVVVLGSLAVLAGDYIPATLDSLMGRIVGVTLLLLGGYVLLRARSSRAQLPDAQSLVADRCTGAAPAPRADGGDRARPRPRPQWQLTAMSIRSVPSTTSTTGIVGFTP